MFEVLKGCVSQVDRWTLSSGGGGEKGGRVRTCLQLGKVL